jgi:hypothetical protein
MNAMRVLTEANRGSTEKIWIERAAPAIMAG